MTQKFFDERSDQSEVKARIVQKYFDVWSKVVAPAARLRSNRIAYVDLYAGPGRYKDGSASTPLLVLQHAIGNSNLCKMLVTYFNDQEVNNASTLQEEIDALDGIEKLAHKPIVNCLPVDEEAAKFFSSTRLVPTFSFIDPFGYKGLSLDIIKGVIKDWGCDCVFFFNYNRINAGISNPVVRDHMNALFGEQRADELRAQLPGKSPELREALILESLAAEIRALGGEYVLPFTFKNEQGTRTSHKIIFVSKAFKGYEIMKDIMAKESSTDDQGVASFEYSPADASTPLLFSLNRSLDRLQADLLKDLAGESMTRDQIYERHSVNTPFIKPNYNAALKQMESEGKIQATSPKPNRRQGTFADHVTITFPEAIGG